MATQADIDAIAAALDQVATDLRTAVEAVQAELNDIIAKSPPLDLTALTAKVQSLDAQAKQVGGLVPAAA